MTFQQFASPLMDNQNSNGQTNQNPQPQQTNSQPTPPPIQNNDGKPANYQLGKYIPLNATIKLPPHNLKFDEQAFTRLLAISICLDKADKKRIISKIPELKQAQIDELFRIFRDEQLQFAALSEKHVPYLEKMAKQHAAEWIDIVNETVLANKKSEDEAKAEEIRKQIGL